jgi:hypothetical protein
MDGDQKFWVRIWGIIATVLIVIIFVMAVNCSQTNSLVAQQPTCYGKVLQQTWDRASDEILALQKCDGK